MRGRRASFVVASAALALSAAMACSTFTEAPAVGAEAGADSPATTSDASADAGPAPSGASCKAILAAEPSRKGMDGVYDLAAGGVSIPIYCDMTAEGGGWTLVGRSAPGAVSTSFGWTRSTGAVAELGYPYSLGAAGLSIAFGEVLVADRAEGGTGIGEYAYRFAVKADFLAANQDAGVDVRPALVVRGDCTPTGGPQMLRYAGATSFDNVFFLRDLIGVGTRNGLAPGGFDLAYDDCNRGGLLNRKQGVIFVR